MSQITVDLPDSLRRQVEEMARTDGVTLDQFVSSAVAEKLSALMTEEYLARRAARGSRPRFERVLARIPDVEPDPEDALPRPGTECANRE